MSERPNIDNLEALFKKRDPLWQKMIAAENRNDIVAIADIDAEIGVNSDRLVQSVPYLIAYIRTLEATLGDVRKAVAGADAMSPVDGLTTVYAVKRLVK